MHAFDNCGDWLSRALVVGCGTETASDYPSSIAGVIGQALVENCPNGGVVIGYGIDENTNGVLDTNEVDGTETICHGTNGADGQDGAQGPQGEQGPQGAAGQDGAQGLRVSKVPQGYCRSRWCAGPSG